MLSKPSVLNPNSTSRITQQDDRKFHTAQQFDRHFWVVGTILECSLLDLFLKRTTKKQEYTC